MFNYSIDFEEFSEWIYNDEEIQNFLVETIQYQTRTHALTIYKKYYDKYIECFPGYEEVKKIEANCESEEIKTKALIKIVVCK